MTEDPNATFSTKERIIPNAACFDCGGRCVLKLHVKDKQVIRLETDDGEEPQIRACARGRAMRKQVYAPDRLLYPQKRVGARGEGTFQRISWDEALDTVAGELLRVKRAYGNKAILAITASGGVGSLHTGNYTTRPLIKSLGGYTSAWGDPSAEGAIFAGRATYGTLTCGSERKDLVQSRLIILWGANPATSIFSTNTSYHLARAKEAGARIIILDPRYTATAAVFGDEWIPIRPGTDGAVMAAMAHVMINENLHDAEFIERCTVGFDKFREYILGIEDGVPKTPAWAGAKSGVAAEAIVNLARQYTAIKPAALIPGFAPGRTAYGEQFHRMTAVLAAMSGNVGLLGGGAACFERPILGPMVPVGYSKNFEGGPYETRLRHLDVPRRLAKQPHACRLWDSILEGTAGGYANDYKLAYISHANPLNQYPNINKGVQALKKLDFIVVHELFMTATARFADILLPVVTHWERNDIVRPWLGGPYFLYQNQAIEPLGETKSDFDICRELAPRLDLPDPYDGMTEDLVIRQIAESMGDVFPEVGDFEAFKRKGVHKIKRSYPVIPFENEVKYPKNNPFSTLSGKIEIYSQVIADLKNPDLPPVPKFIDPWEGPEDPLYAKYPMQLITVKQKTRAHSCFANNLWLKDMDPQRVWINTSDAQRRNIRDADDVRVFNDRGETVIRAKVTDRIMPGVVALGEGAWYSPDDKGRDRAGSPNILNRDHYSPGGAFPFNTTLVQVEKFVEET